MSVPALRIFTRFCLLGILVILAGCSVISVDPRYFYASSEYSLVINTNEPLSNVTFFIPLPVKNGTPVTGDIILNPDMFEQTNYSVSFVDSPPEWNFSGIFIPRENTPVWVKIQTDLVLPDTSGNEYSIRIENRTRQKSPLTFSDTLYPLENQSVFMPKLQFISPAVTRIKLSNSHTIVYNPIKISQQIPVYAEYSTSPTALVEIFSKNGRSNLWLESYEEYRWNEYNEKFDLMHTGPSHGWFVAEGEFIAADGSYPNFADPVWQKVLNDTS